MKQCEEECCIISVLAQVNHRGEDYSYEVAEELYQEVYYEIYKRALDNYNYWKRIKEPKEFLKCYSALFDWIAFQFCPRCGANLEEKEYYKNMQTEVMRLFENEQV